EIAPKGKTVRLWSRLGNEKTRQFPEIAAALGEWARRRTQPLVLDGEIVALDPNCDPTGFPNLQGRIHLGGRDGEAGCGARAWGARFSVASTQLRADRQLASRGVHRLRPPARRHDRLPGSAARRPACGAR